MKKVFFCFVAFLTITLPVLADDAVRVEHREVASAPLSLNELQKLDEVAREQCHEANKDRFDVQELITLGKEIWQIVKDGAPTVNFASHSASVIPAAALCPFYMSSWNLPQSKTYELNYKNAFNMNMVNFTYKVIYSCGGQFEGRGNYLANVAIHPEDIHVKWGQSFDADVKIANALNIGTQEDPVAGLEIALELKLKNPVTANHAKRSYFVDGLCRITPL